MDRRWCSRSSPSSTTSNTDTPTGTPTWTSSVTASGTSGLTPTKLRALSVLADAGARVGELAERVDRLVFVYEAP